MSEPKEQVVTVRLSEDLAKELDRYRNTRCIPRATAIRRIVEEALREKAARG